MARRAKAAGGCFVWWMANPGNAEAASADAARHRREPPKHRQASDLAAGAA